MGDLLPLTLHAIPYATEHYDKVWNPVRNTYKKIRGQVPAGDPDIRNVQIMEDRGYILRKRSEVQSDEEIVEVVRHRGERLPRRPGLPHETSSMADLHNKQMVLYRGDDRRGRNRDISGSEGSLPLRSQNGRDHAHARAKSANGFRRRSPSPSSSELGSSTDDEKKLRNIKRKKWLTAGLAGVATVHAAAKVYSSIEKHDKRIEEVKSGAMSPEEAHKKHRAAQWQDAGAIAIAALGIKGAMSEWNETMEHQKEHMELLKNYRERHDKRLERERRKKAQEHTGYYKGRDGEWYYDHEESQGYGRSESRSVSRRSKSSADY
jgi:hypothetical protein